jgi:hypothetical protein
MCEVCARKSESVCECVYVCVPVLEKERKGECVCVFVKQLFAFLISMKGEKKFCHFFDTFFFQSVALLLLLLHVSRRDR